MQTQIGRCELDNVIGGQVHINEEILTGISSDTGIGELRCCESD